MDNIPKPTSEFNRLIGEADYLMSLISLEIQCRLNYFNPISEEMEIFEKLPRTKKKTYINLNFTNGNPKLKAKFKETLEGKQINFGGYEKERAEEIFDRYDEIVQKRNKIFHGFPYSIDGKYVKKYRNLSKKEDIIIEEEFLRNFIQQCKEIIDALYNPDFDSIIQEFMIVISKHLNIDSTVSNVRSAISKFNLASNIKLDVSVLTKMADLTKKISEEPTSHQHKQ